MFKFNLLYFSLCPLSRPIPWHYWEEPGSVFAFTPLGTYIHKIPNIKLIWRLSSPSSLSYDRCFSSLIIFLALYRTSSNKWGASMWMRSPELDPGLQMHPDQCRGEGSPPLAYRQCTFCCCQGYCWPDLQRWLAALCSACSPQGSSLQSCCPAGQFPVCTSTR